MFRQPHDFFHPVSPLTDGRQTRPDTEAFLIAILEAIPDPLFIKDQHHRWITVNDAFCELVGQARENLLGKTDYDFLPKSQADRFWQQDELAFQQGKTEQEEELTNTQGLTHILLTKKTVLTQVALQQSAEYRELAAREARKSQELQETLQQLRQTQTNLVQAEKMSSLGQMVAGVAHEINNPVSFIYGNVEHCRDYVSDLLRLVKLYQKYCPQSQPEIEELIQEIDLDFIIEDLPQLLNSMQVGAERIRDIVKCLRTFSRLDEAEMKAVNLHENIDSTLRILEHRLKPQPHHPPIQIIRDYGNLPLVECYAGQLNQVFMNLLVNAIDAIEEKQHSLTLEDRQKAKDHINIITGIDNNQVKICITDTGLGIKEENISRIFDPFYTTKPIGKGTGMGLAISYQIVVEKHCGKLYCDSKLGSGTQFVIEIPIDQHQETTSGRFQT